MLETKRNALQLARAKAKTTGLAMAVYLLPRDRYAVTPADSDDHVGRLGCVAWFPPNSSESASWKTF